MYGKKSMGDAPNNECVRYSDRLIPTNKFHGVVSIDVMGKPIIVDVKCRPRNGHPNDATATNDRAVQVVISVERKNSSPKLDGKTETLDGETTTWAKVLDCDILRRDTMINPDAPDAENRARLTAKLVASAIRDYGLDNILGKLRVIDEYMMTIPSEAIPNYRENNLAHYNNVKDRLEAL